jgi:hypothetical protein
LASASVKFPARKRTGTTMTIWLMRHMTIQLYIFLKSKIRKPNSKIYHYSYLPTQVRIHTRVERQLIKVLDIFQRIKGQLL